MSYRNILDDFGLLSLTKPPNIPDYHLMVGSAENLTPQPVTIYTETKVPTAIVSGWGKYSDLSSEELEQMVADGTIEVNDINWNVAMIGG